MPLSFINNLHWLPLPYQIQFKILLLAHPALSGVAYKESGSDNSRSKLSCEIRVPKTSPWGQGLRTCWPPTVEHSPFSYQEYPESSRFQAGSKDLLTSFGICSVNQFVYSDCDVLFSLSLSVLSVMFSVYQHLLAL